MPNLTGLYPLPHGNSTLLSDPLLCTTLTCDLSLAPVSYQPSLQANALFLSIFGFCLAFQIGIGFRFRTYDFTSIIVFGFILEIVGYTARLLVWKNPFSLTYFSLQLATLAAGPTFLSLGIYTCFGRIVVIYGEDKSRFKARTYTIPLVSITSIILLLQLIGGIIITSKDTTIIRTGKDILVTSFVIHLLILIIFIILVAEFSLRVYQSRSFGNTPSPTETSLFEAFLIGLALSTLLLLTRTIFRTIELSSGFKGPVARKQILFIIAEGVLVTIIALILTVLHPGPSFQGFYSSSDYLITRNQPKPDDLVEITVGKRISISSSAFSTRSRNTPNPNSDTDIELNIHNGLESPPMYEESEEEGSVRFALGMSTRAIQPGMVRMQQLERPTNTRVEEVVDDLELEPPDYGGVVGVRYEDTRGNLPIPTMVERC
ncbi:RTA1 like protein-domain-containing protein [Tricladium varicosporioides]|nr:RTA1 like protein-domain-containing protein [Hymenoscyphus varicosporioides]